MAANSVLLLDGDAYREQHRLLLMLPFRRGHLTSYADTITAAAHAAIAGCLRNEPIALHPLMRALTPVIILRVVFGLNEGARLENLRSELARSLPSSSVVGRQVLFGLDPTKVRAALKRRHFYSVDRLLYAEIEQRGRRRWKTHELSVEHIPKRGRTARMDCPQGHNE